MLFRKAKNLVGLDIGSSAVKLIELKEGKEGTFHLVKAGLETLSPEAIVDGAIMDSSLVVETITRLLASTGVKNPNVAVSVSGHSVIVKKIMLPTMPEEELSESIRWEAEQYVPFDINDVYLDYVVLDPGAVGETMGVLLVAAKKEKVDDFKNVVTQAGRQPSLVDVDAFALQNCYEVNYGADPGRVVALVNIGASVMNVNILAQGQTVFWRDITFGGNQFTDALQKAYSLNFEQAESLKKGEPVAGQTAQSIQPVLTGRLRGRGGRAPEDARLLPGDVGRRPRRLHRRLGRRLEGRALRGRPEGQVRPARRGHEPVPVDLHRRPRGGRRVALGGLALARDRRRSRRPEDRGVAA